MADEEDKYAKAQRERKKYTDAVVNSSSRAKVVVAGPGTGKTFLFKEILKGKNRTLTLTFINSLVEDLTLELFGLSEVKTLHGYARSELAKALKKEVKLFPKLPQLIAQDAKILLEKSVDFDQILHNKETENENLAFYSSRKTYYDNYYGYSDVIFDVVKYFETHKDKVPEYEQIVVDEFQDFNKLEVSLIELLAEKSPTLLAGDDDQALYIFKQASPEHIRSKHGEESADYESFNLPYCSRCVRVTVEATNDIIKAATSTKLLDGRINKPYIYFDDKDKDKVSNQNPKVVYNQSYAKQIPWFIEKQIGEIANEIKSSFTVLIIAPTKMQTKILAESLKNKGFSNIDFVDKDDQKEPTLIDGLRLLQEDSKGNLGWRILAKFFLSQEDFEKLVKATTEKDAKPIYELVGKNVKDEINKILKTSKNILKNNAVNDIDLADLIIKTGHNSNGISKEFLKNKINNDSLRTGNPGLRKIPIKITTVQSSKGLAADYVFIVHFDDQYFIKDKDKAKISTQDVCNFLVALTRARRKVLLVSSDKNKEPTFLGWINKAHIERK